MEHKKTTGPMREASSPVFSVKASKLPGGAAAMNQCERLLTRLRQGPITAGEAFGELGIGRMSARVMDLRTLGFPITTELIPSSNRFGDRCRIARYRLAGRGE